MIFINMDKAREIKRDQFRRERAPLLSALDIEYQKADEQGDELGKASLVGQKQALRDVTRNSAIDAAETPDQLTNITLSELIKTAQQNTL